MTPAPLVSFYRAGLNSQLSAAFAATAVDDFTTIFGGHALTKSVFALTLTITWLIRY